mmetsp:Transcript_19107/g.31669  ORF Transcript_19107/g.31669 Transcript_19107/m.31669 type:complete len:85 (+) Transcript_19107:312-566(+)
MKTSLESEPPGGRTTIGDTEEELARSFFFVRGTVSYRFARKAVAALPSSIPAIPLQPINGGFGFDQSRCVDVCLAGTVLLPPVS